MMLLLRSCAQTFCAVLPLLLIVSMGLAQERTYTLDADFDEGTMINVNHDDVADQLQLDSKATPFNFVWIAASARGTVVKIDTNTGEILGEFRTTPTSQGGGNPSRTTVDNDGSVWVGNRNDVWMGDDGVYYGTVLHIGLLENNQCEDRNNNGIIDTSTGLSDIKSWTDTSGARSVATAADECIVHYVKVNSRGTRHVSVDGNNDVWVGGLQIRNFDLVKGGRYDVAGSGTIIRSETSVGFGGYGGLIDGNGVIWSANPLLRWDTANPLSGPNGDPDPPWGAHIGPPIPGTNWAGQSFGYYGDSYGLCIDSQGNVWNTNLQYNTIWKFAPDGTWLGTYSHGSWHAQGCVVDGNDHVWVAHSLIGPSTTVGHLLNNGTHVGNVSVGSGPTGVAVDANGKIWAANINSDNVYRIDPNAGPIGRGGVHVGAWDLIVSLGPGAGPYNYSDMTGSTLIAPPSSGTWTVVYDSGDAGQEWGYVSWTSDEPGDSGISVTAASSTDGVTFGSAENVTQGVDLTVADGQYLKVSVSFTRASTGESPVLEDLSIVTNRPPDCTEAAANPAEIWPPNHKMVDVDIIGVTDPDGDELTFTITDITQDEPLTGGGSGNFAPDGAGVDTPYAQVRAERAGRKKTPGNGRVYEVSFVADDGKGGTCEGAVQTCVPHDMRKGHACIDDGQFYDSTGESAGKMMPGELPTEIAVTAYPNPFNPTTTIAFTLPETQHVRLSVYDVTGREVSQLVDRSVEAGTHEVVFDASNLSSGVYLYRLTTGMKTIAHTLLLVK